MNKKLQLLERVFILGIVFVFFSSSYSYAVRPKPKRARAKTHPATTVKYKQPASRTSVRRSRSTSNATNTRPVHTSVTQVTEQVNAEIARQTRTHAKHKTKQEWLHEYRLHPEELHNTTPMYKAFKNADDRVKKAEVNEETIDRLTKQMAQIYRENTKRIAMAKTTSEVYGVLLQSLKTNRAYPPSRSSQYHLVYDRLHGGKRPSLSALQVRPELRREYESDPELYKLYQLDELARAVCAGQKPWTALETELNRAFTNLAAEEQTALRQMDAHYDQVWHDFPQWYEHNKENILLTHETRRVFEEILYRTTTRFRGADDGEIVQTISDLSRVQLGNNGDGVSYRVIYRGQVSRGIQSEKFHLVAEKQGVPLRVSMHGLFPQRVAHINFWLEDGQLAGIELKEDVTPQDIQTFIDTILEKNFSENWRIRMGQDEPGRQKIYFEQINNESGMDMSYALQIKIKTPSLREQRKHDPDFFRKFFGKYM